MNSPRLYNQLHISSLVLVLGLSGCGDDETVLGMDDDAEASSESGDGDGDDSGATGSESDSGDGDGDSSTGDGDGDEPSTGDGDGDSSTDTDSDTGDGDGDAGDGDGDVGDGDGDTGDGDGDTGDGDGDGAEPMCGNMVVEEGEECDDGNELNHDACLDDCTVASCGDGYVFTGDDENDAEACDDGNLQDGDGCESSCSITPGARKVVNGLEHTCALFWTGEVRCWGNGEDGRLGYGSTDNIGAADLPMLPAVGLSGPAVDIEAGSVHTCAILADQSLVCWGDNSRLQLGYGFNDGEGETEDVGDDEDPGDAGVVLLGDDFELAQVAPGGFQTCALSTGGAVKCWGSDNAGELGLGDGGDLETPGTELMFHPSLGDIQQIDAGYRHTCVVDEGDRIQCWGLGDQGRLGYGDDDPIGDEDGELQQTEPLLMSKGPGISIIQLAVGWEHNCVLYSDGTMRCWGRGGNSGGLGRGRLGYGNTENLEDASMVVDLPIQEIDEIFAGRYNTCARAGSEVRCWGEGELGATGLERDDDIGDDVDELVNSPALSLSIEPRRLVVGSTAKHVCALAGSELVCWGPNEFGQLGLPTDEENPNVGDDPTEIPPPQVIYF